MEGSARLIEVEFQSRTIYSGSEWLASKWMFHLVMDQESVVKPERCVIPTQKYISPTNLSEIQFLDTTRWWRRGAGPISASAGLRPH